MTDPHSCLILDWNGVISTRVPGTADDRQVMPGAVESLSQLLRNHFPPQRVFIVSTSKRSPEATRQRFKQFDIQERVGIFPDHLFIVDTLDEKVAMARELGGTHAVDNDPKVLLKMSWMKVRVLFRPKIAVEEVLAIDRTIRPAFDWRAAQSKLITDLCHSA